MGFSGAAVFRSRPQRAGAILEQGSETIAGDSGLAGALEYPQTHTVEAHQAAEGGEPQITVSSLENVVDGALRKTVAHGPAVERGEIGRAEPHGNERECRSHAETAGMSHGCPPS
jgi:hypothetical protein